MQNLSVLSSNIVKSAVQNAKKGNMVHRHGCVVFNYKGEILSTGYNQPLLLQQCERKVTGQGRNLVVETRLQRQKRLKQDRFEAGGEA